MSTPQIWSTFVDNSSDVAFRAWGSELSTKLAAASAVQTADTGQINWTTVVRGAINTAAGYEIWKLSSSNLFFKIEYGSGNVVATEPALWFTVGTGSNGSGTLTGQLSTRAAVGLTTTPITSTVTNYTSYLCATPNSLGLSWKLASGGVAGVPRAFFCAQQTVDATGTATTVGYHVAYQQTGSVFTTQCVATTAGVTGVQSTKSPFLIVNNNSNPPANSLDGAGNNQAFLGWFSILGTTPQIPLLDLALILTSDLALGITASMTLVGVAAHTYINAASNICFDAQGGLSTGVSLGMIWE